MIKYQIGRKIYCLVLFSFNPKYLKINYDWSLFYRQKNRDTSLPFFSQVSPFSLKPCFVDFSQKQIYRFILFSKILWKLVMRTFRPWTTLIKNILEYEFSKHKIKLLWRISFSNDYLLKSDFFVNVLKFSNPSVLGLIGKK